MVYSYGFQHHNSLSNFVQNKYLRQEAHKTALYVGLARKREASLAITSEPNQADQYTPKQTKQLLHNYPKYQSV